MLAPGRTTAAPPFRVMIVDDHEVVRAGLELVLGADHRFTVSGVASTPDEALAAVESVPLDLVLLDYRLPGRDGAWLATEILRRRPALSVVVFSSYADDDIVLDCLRAGARGFLTKTQAAQELADALEVAAKGGVAVAPEFLPKLVEWARECGGRVAHSSTLRAGERDVLRLLALGRSNLQIAEILKVSDDYVKTVVRAIKNRLGARGRAQAVAEAVRRGLL